MLKDLCLLLGLVFCTLSALRGLVPTAAATAAAIVIATTATATAAAAVPVAAASAATVVPCADQSLRSGRFWQIRPGAV